MATAKIPDAEFVQLVETHGPYRAAKIIGVGASNVNSRRRRLEKKYGRRINGPERPNSKPIQTHPQRVILEVKNGTVLIGSDAHYWPGEPSLMHRALVAFAKEFKPKVLVMNGDSFDGARISRHPPIGWAAQPTVQEELEVVQDRHNEIALAGPRGCRKVWNLGNHDARFETRIATVAPEFAKVQGMSLKDHFPVWEPAWSTWINDDVVVKHRFKGGMHAPQNNTLWAGRTMVTGHLHSSKVQPISDYNGTRWGVDSGCLADTYGNRAFVDYTEDNPLNWRPGFCVLTFKDGRLLWPELVSAWDEDHVQFRGEIIAV